jgi:hypothetical protein
MTKKKHQITVEVMIMSRYRFWANITQRYRPLLTATEFYR